MLVGRSVALVWLPLSHATAMRALQGVTVLVATPGRLLDHLQNTKAFRTGGRLFLCVTVTAHCQPCRTGMRGG